MFAAVLRYLRHLVSMEGKKKRTLFLAAFYLSIFSLSVYVHQRAGSAVVLDQNEFEIDEDATGSDDPEALALINMVTTKN